MAIESINPTTGERIRSYAEHSSEQIARVMEKSDEAFLAWRRVGFAARSVRMKAAAARLRAGQDEFARLMALEMGKPLAQGRAEIEKCAWVCDYYAQNAEGFLRQEEIATDAAKSYVRFDPLGVVLAVMPWNFPFWQVFRAAAPTLMAGNAMVLKHASNVTGCALAIDGVFSEAGFPDGLFRPVLVGSKQVGGLIDHPLVKAVTLTGSAPAGQAIASRAGRALKKTVLELGGSDPCLILEDADLHQAAETCAVSRLINSGQSCIAAKRFIVVKAVREAFEERFVREMQSQFMGDPFKEGVTIGPMARQDLRDELHRQVEASVARGARLLLGGQVSQSNGAFYPPTVLTDVCRDMPVYEEETFGPVAAVIPVADEKEAVRVANDSRFGLGAAVFTGDTQRGERIAAELEAGCCFVNAFVKSDPRLPFGGVKQSGYGRELSSFGIREFVNIKTVSVK